MEEVGAASNDCDMPFNYLGVDAEASFFAVVLIKDHFLGGAPFCDYGDLYLQFLLCVV